MSRLGVDRRTDVEVCLIGGFDLRQRSVPLALPHGCERIVAFLAIAGGPVERARLAGTLWMDKSQDRAAANLRSALWRLRSTELGVLVESGSRLRLDPSLRVDLDARDRWAERLSVGQAGTEDLDIDVSRLGDELLPDWYDDWVLMERERFRQRTLHAAEKLVHALAAAGRHAEAIDVAYSAVILEPLRETTHRALVLAHLAEGNRGEAVRHIDRCRALFMDELGYDIGPNLIELLNPCTVA